MTFPTILILVILTSGISAITRGLASDANAILVVPSENEIIPEENETIVVPGGNILSTGSIIEMSHRQKDVTKTFRCLTIDGRYPHPENCEYYYECRFSVPSLFQCKRGYLYDREREECRHKRSVKCHIGNERDHNHHRDRDDKDKEIDVKEEDGRNFKCPYNWGTFAHPYDCSKYYVCINNYPKLVQCNRDFRYHTEYRKCLPNNKVKCGNRLDRDQMRTSRRPVTFTTTVQPRRTTTVTPKERRSSRRPVTITTSVRPRRTTTVTPKDPYPSVRTTASPIFSTLTPSTMKKIPELTTSEEPIEFTTRSTSTASTTTSSITITPVPTRKITTPSSSPTTTTSTSVPTTTTTPKTTTSFPTTVATNASISTTETASSTTPEPVTTSSFPTTSEPISTTTPTTLAPPTTTISSEGTTTEKFSTILPVTKPNTPPPTECEEDDLDCIIDKTGDISDWFDCPERFGHFPHGSSRQLFIHCDNWKPFVKTCAENTRFSPIYLVCVWENNVQDKLK